VSLTKTNRAARFEKLVSKVGWVKNELRKSQTQNHSPATKHSIWKTNWNARVIFRLQKVEMPCFDLQRQLEKNYYLKVGKIYLIHRKILSNTTQATIMINLSHPSLLGLTAGHFHILFLCHEHELLPGSVVGKLPRTFKPAVRSLNLHHKLIHRRHKGYELTAAGKTILEMIVRPEPCPSAAQKEFIATLPPSTSAASMVILCKAAKVNFQISAENLAAGDQTCRGASGLISHMVNRKILQASSPESHNPRRYILTSNFRANFLSIKIA
jgi:hypothetical protein